MICGRDLIVVVTKKREEILVLGVRAFKCGQIGDAVARRKKRLANRIRAATCGKGFRGTRNGRIDDRARSLERGFACRVVWSGGRAEDGLQRAALALDVGGNKQELAAFVNGETSRAAKLILVADVGGVAERVVGREASAAIILMSLAVQLVCAGF